MTARLLPVLAAAGILFAGCNSRPAKTAPKPSSERFLGLHLDFHASVRDSNIGANTTPEMVQAIIETVHPDFIQVDCKGHPGNSSYPTKVGNPAPGLAKDSTGASVDPLKIWREVTARNGIALYTHYSGIWDNRAVELHPSWGALRSDGSIRKGTTSLFGSYADSLLIPQLKELAGEYKVDGVWIDGDCWAAYPDYCDAAVKGFREQYNAEPPKAPGEPLWYEWKQFHREAFRAYVRHYAEAVHAEYPDFRICSNWAFTHHMPEPVSAPVDFISGDYSPLNSVNYARIAARYASSQGMPWDLMSWGFVRDGDARPSKPAVQLMREAAITLSQGGGYQVYYTQNRDGSVNLEKLRPMAEVSRFARDRQPFCFHSETVPQIALLYSTWDYQHRDKPGDPANLYPTLNDRVEGMLQGLLACGYSVDLMGEDALAARMKRYPLVVVPAVVELSPEFRGMLERRERRGGKVLWAEACEEGLRAAVAELFPDPLAKVDAPCVDLVLRRQGRKLQIHLINTSGDHAGTPLISEIPPVEDVRVFIRCKKAPRRITCQPSGQPLEFCYADGLATLTLPHLDIYDIIEVER